MIIQANISNLISLWKNAADPVAGYFHGDGFDYCYMENSEWPNRLWFIQEITENNVVAAKQSMLFTSTKLVVPFFEFQNDESRQILEQQGFEQKSMQFGMSIPIKEHTPKLSRLQFVRVLNKQEAKLWASVYPKAFNYHICESIISKSLEKIEYYLAVYKRQPIGTAIVYKTGSITGLHGLGVIPRMRRQGFAEEIMHFVFDLAFKQQSSHLTLQASAMGRGLYDKLGFREDFKLINYFLRQDEKI